MKIRGAIVSFVVVALLVAAVGLSFAEESSISNFAALRNDMELAKGALNQTVGMTVLNTYIPDFGVVFIFTVRSGMSIEETRAEVERALRFLGPSLERLDDDERIVMIAQREGFLSFWEVMYITTKGQATNPTSWTVYISEK